MGSYILRRMLIMLPSVLGISVVLFTVLALAPGDPFEELATNPAVPAEVRQMLRDKFGLDDPVWQRYFRWLAAMLQGDWGYSFVSRIDVDTLILQRVPVTLAIIGASQVLALMVALPVGIYSAMRPYSLFDRIASTFAFVGFSLPTFFTGILFILIFSITLDWLQFVSALISAPPAGSGGGNSSNSRSCRSPCSDCSRARAGLVMCALRCST